MDGWMDEVEVEWGCDSGWIDGVEVKGECWRDGDGEWMRCTWSGWMDGWGGSGVELWWWWWWRD